MSSVKPAKVKPAVCLLGPYSSGKTFLVNFLLKEPLFTSEVEPVTAVVTVIRHIEDKPADWPSDKNVFVLKNKTDLRTLDFGCTKGSHDYADLSRLTTYSESVRHEAVVVFLDKDFLRKCMLLDCPGVGNRSEAVFDDEPDEAPNRPRQRSLTRERELQNRAIASADALVMLSSLAGGNGGLADSNTANILFAIAAHMTPSPTVVSHGNVLIVGSMADPGKRDLEDEESVLGKLQVALQQQLENLPPEQRAKFDPTGLKKRIVLFFALDARQRQIALHRAKMEIKRYTPNMEESEVIRKAHERLDEIRLTRERTAAFEAALDTGIDQVLLATGGHRGQVLKSFLDASLSHYAARRARHAPQLGHRHYEALSGRYDDEAVSRENAWRAVVTSFESDVDHSTIAIKDDLEKALKHWANEQNVSRLLEKEFGGDKARAHAHALRLVCDRISSELGDSLRRHAASPQVRARQQVEAFDRKWFVRGAALESGSGASDLPSMRSASTPQAWEDVTKCLPKMAGGALSPGADAQAPIRALLGAAGAFGATAAISGGNWVFCWVVAAAAGTLTYLWPKLVWRSALSKAISSWVREQHPRMTSEVRGVVEVHFGEIRKLGLKALEEARALLAAHVLDVHEHGKSKVAHDHLTQAAGFYESHIAALQRAHPRTGAVAKGDPG
jgi:hypothetical protein